MWQHCNPILNKLRESNINRECHVIKYKECHVTSKDSCDMVDLLCAPGQVFTKGLGQVLGLNSILLYRTFKPKTLCEYGPKCLLVFMTQGFVLHPNQIYDPKL